MKAACRHPILSHSHLFCSVCEKLLFNELLLMLTDRIMNILLLISLGYPLGSPKDLSTATKGGAPRGDLKGFRSIV